jgi:hypothetical protein
MSINDFADMLNQSVTLTEMASRDAYGMPSYGTPASYESRITYKDQLVRDKNGQEVVAKGFVWIQGTPTITPEYQLTLPDNSTPPILTTETYYDDKGAHHVKVYFG